MDRYDRSWPAAVTAIIVGGLLGFGLTASRFSQDEGRLTLGECDCEATEVAPADIEPATPADIPDVAVKGAVADGRERIVGPRNGSVLVLRSPPMRWATVEALLDDLRSSPDVRARRSAAARLGAVDAPGRVMGALMISLMTDADKHVRARAAESLGRVGGATAVEPLGVAAREDAEPRVRESAALGLGLTRDPLAVPILAEMLERDPSHDVRLRAARSLSEIVDGRD